MTAIILANLSLEARTEPVALPQFAASARHGLPTYPLPRQRVAISPDTGGDVRSAGNRPRCNRCAMSALARSIKSMHNVRAHRLPQFPATLEPKTGAELCCISSGNTASRKFHATNRRHAPRAIAYSAGKPRRNPVHVLDVVSMLTKICVH